MTSMVEKKRGAAWVGIVLLVSVLCVVVLVVLQVMEWQTYGGDSSVWPS